MLFILFSCSSPDDDGVSDADYTPVHSGSTSSTHSALVVPSDSCGSPFPDSFDTDSASSGDIYFLTQSLDFCFVDSEPVNGWASASMWSSRGDLFCLYGWELVDTSPSVDMQDGTSSWLVEFSDSGDVLAGDCSSFLLGRPAWYGISDPVGPWNRIWTLGPYTLDYWTYWTGDSYSAELSVLEADPGLDVDLDLPGWFDEKIVP